MQGYGTGEPDHIIWIKDRCPPYCSLFCAKVWFLNLLVQQRNCECFKSRIIIALLIRVSLKSHHYSPRHAPTQCCKRSSETQSHCSTLLLISLGIGDLEIGDRFFHFAQGINQHATNKIIAQKFGNPSVQAALTKDRNFGLARTHFFQSIRPISIDGMNGSGLGRKVGQIDAHGQLPNDIVIVLVFYKTCQIDTISKMKWKSWIITPINGCAT